ncbi:MAG: trypsin-like peptidase domain-containing protein [Acidobacteria bacterium]|nr:trypsin-like peptidase domain-containing protein [Acidobacteriota bacterium]
MTRGFAWLTVALTAAVGVLIGMAMTGGISPNTVMSGSPVVVSPPAASPSSEPVMSAVTLPGALPGTPSVADIAERLNPVVVNIDASARGRRARTALGTELPRRPAPFEDLGDDRRQRSGETPRRGTGTGFLIDPTGLILTNHHVIEGAERITVKLADGRSLRGQVVGSDPDTDIALIKVDAPAALPAAVLGNSDTLRVGEWVLAIGNPLAYEHTATVGIVSFIGRKLFDSSLDNYIQTDAAITFGNSGGPLINMRGEVIGINAAVSRQVSNIGFAVPINQARAILPQLRTAGRVSRGYIGVALRDVDPDIQTSLGLPRGEGALVQDVTAGSPGARAGVKPYDLIVAVDGEVVRSNDALIREIAERRPGSTARLELLRDGRSMELSLKLAERPGRVLPESVTPTLPAGRGLERDEPIELGLTLIEIDAANAHRFDVPAGMTGLLVQRVEPFSAAYDAGITRGQILLEINRRPVDSVVGYRRSIQAGRDAGVLAVFLYDPDLDQRAIHTVRLEPR